MYVTEDALLPNTQTSMVHVDRFAGFHGESYLGWGLLSFSLC
jgi:hypothetical protein